MKAFPPIILIGLAIIVQKVSSLSNCQWTTVCPNECSTIEEDGESPPENTNCRYIYMEDKKTWDAAKDSCESQGKVLAEFTTEERRQWLHEFANKYAAKPIDTWDMIWIGGHKTPDDLGWSWVSSGNEIETIGTGNGFWYTAEPTGDGSCLSLLVKPGKLNDASCVKHELQYICMSKNCSL